MASLQARHTRACALGRPWTTFAEAGDGCTCAPSYYVAVREGRKLHREGVGKNRKTAERALRKIATAEDEGSYRPQLTIRFNAWADRWLKSLERKETTRDSYRSTMTYAKRAFGEKIVRRLTVADIVRFGEVMKTAHQTEVEKGVMLARRPLSASTRAKHLRVLGACLNAAIAHGYAARNPVTDLPRSEKPRPVRKESAYFEQAELQPVFAQLPEGVYRVISEVALKTGARQGELIALTWGAVDLAGAVLRVRLTRTDGYVHEPKNHEKRDVDLTADVVQLLGRWWGELDKPADDAIVFPGPTREGYLDPSTWRSELYRAMRAAGVDRRGPTGIDRTVHSLRHTFAKRALEGGAPITWLSRHLGHSSVLVTDGVYGHFEKAERQRQVAALEGAFGL